MRFLIVYLNNEYRPMVPVNLTAIEGYVRLHGHEISVFDTSFYAEMLNLQNVQRNVMAGSHFGIDYSSVGVSIIESSLEEDFINKIMEFQPHLIGLGVYSFTLDKADMLAQAAKRHFPDIPVIYGGIYPTLQPENTLKREWVDMICVGEGEQATRELCDAIEEGRDLRGISNIWVKENGATYRTPLRPLMDVDELPEPDWRSYKQYHHYGPIEGKIYKLGLVEFGRGCPNSCAYCEGAMVRSLYNKEGFKRWSRHKSPEKFVNDCVALIEKYGIEFFYFVDGTFINMPTHVLEKLAHLYSQKVKRPFLCLTTVPSINEKRAHLLKEMGCFQINLGVEAATDQYRRNVLNRPTMTNEQIVKIFKILNKVGIRTLSYNMIGLPWQNRQDVFNLIELERQCNPTRTEVTIFVPFESIPLTRRLKELGLVNERNLPKDETSATVKVPTDMSLEEIEGLHRTFNLYCRVPKELFPLIEACEKDSEVSRFVLKKLHEIYTDKDRIR